MVCTCLLATGCKSSKDGKSGNSNTQQPSKPKTLFKFDKSPTLSQLLDKAAKENKPVFVDFYTTWCTPCKMMDEDVFTDSGLAAYYNENFLNYKVDCEKDNGVNLASIFGINTYPTLIFLDEKGSVLVKHESAAYHSKMQQLGEDALFEFKNRSTQ